ncbi:MAG TPA: hypothetical protein VJK29_14645, partial [Terriglobales bacterium]|nr:hypothetical protein [Terriglobales bacterium]
HFLHVLPIARQVLVPAPVATTSPALHDHPPRPTSLLASGMRSAGHHRPAHTTPARGYVNTRLVVPSNGI